MCVNSTWITDKKAIMKDLLELRHTAWDKVGEGYSHTMTARRAVTFGIGKSVRRTRR